MCGIAGIVSLRASAGVDLRERVSTMCEAIKHRGPDDYGVELCAGGLVALGNQRLAIRDISPAGHMPMANAAGDVRITYNGEIYNAGDVRRELERDGVAFRSNSDTEVILHGYEKWGEGVLSRLRGMFAFAIVDERNGGAKLFLARDPLGIKPLYYAVTSDTFVFASECRAIVLSGLVSREISPNALVTYLRLGSVPAPLTIYRDIRALTAGAMLTIDIDGNASTPSPRTYWTLPPADQRRTTENRARADLRAVLADSVTRHLVSDVPLGAFLSGGIDSTAIVALTRAALPQSTIRTCTLAFEGSLTRDVTLARVTARAFDTEHVEVPITAEEVARDLDAIVAALDQPSNDGVNTYLVSQAARRAGLTVALSGIGGDELFGGYPSFRRLGPAVHAGSVGAAIGAARLVDAAASAVAPHHAITRILEWTAVGGGDAAAQYLGLRGFFAESALPTLVSKDVLSSAESPLQLIRALNADARPSKSMWDNASRFELTCYMRHQLLRDADVMSMAHSLEVRVPFVDRDVVEAVLALPDGVRAGHPPKRLLRAVVPNLPPEIRDRSDKETFTVPLDRWMLGPLRRPLAALIECAEETLRGLLKPGAGQRVLEDFDAGRAHWSRAWAMAALATIKVLPLALSVALTFSAACSEPPDPRRTNFRVERDNVKAQYDEKTGRMKRLEVDTNKNGKTDTWTFMDGTRIDRIEIDRDEDGKIDRWEYYVGNKLEKVGTSTRGDGIVDEWAYRRASGTVERVETDTDRDGRIDKWESFDEPSTPGGTPALREVAMDPDASGRPTRRLLYNARGELLRVEKMP